jgi:uncharacterized damage-inducible protein DinB
MSAPSLTPEQAVFLLHYTLGYMQQEHATTKRVIEAIPEDKSDYKPDAASKSAIELAWHIVVTEGRFLDSVHAGEFDLNPRPRPESVRTPADIARWYDEMFAAKLPNIKQMSPEQLGKEIDFRGIMRFPAVVFLQILLNHSIHHRGQLSTYLRPMGGKVPSIYGESYDAAQARMAAQGQ